MNNLFEDLRPLEPVATSETFIINETKDFANIKVVVFDIYGTLLISDSGDIGGVYHGVGHAVAVLEQAGFQFSAPHSPEDVGRNTVQEYLKVINDTHKTMKKNGIEFPEVDIADVWKKVLATLEKKDFIKSNSHSDVKYIATHFEFLNNPTYPMPGMLEVLETLVSRGYSMGIISNAQFFTPRLLKYFMGDNSYLNGGAIPLFDNDLIIYSYKEGLAKPGAEMYQKLASKLAERNIDPSDVIFIGNDMLNDIYPANRVGFKTALFAGDKRSLRLRVGNPKTKGLSPDMVLTDLKQLFEVLGGVVPQ